MVAGNQTGVDVTMRKAGYVLLATLSFVSLLPRCHTQGEGSVQYRVLGGYRII